VDVPSLDGVAFIDPKSSKVDIVQAVGRSIRLSGNKKVGTIVLPVFIKDNDDAEVSIQASNFKPVWDVLNALKAHDDVLSFELDQLRTDLGRKKSLGKGDDGVSKVAFDLPSNIDPSFSDSLKTHLVEKTTSSWNFWFGLLEAYVEREGNALVHALYKTENGFNLGQWVSSQRKKNHLTPEQIKRLEALPKWSWSRFDDKFETGYRYLIQYVNENGNANPSGNVQMNDGFKLGLWVSNRRRSKSIMSQDQIQKLEALSGWSWDIASDFFKKGYAQLLQFKKINSHSKVPKGFETKDGFKLGDWVASIRKRKDQLSPEQLEQLENLSGWTWNPHLDAWEKSFSYLIQFAKTNGHARVSTMFKTNDGFKLGSWVANQRTKKKNNQLTPDQIRKLESVEGWVWNARE